MSRSARRPTTIRPLQPRLARAYRDTAYRVDGGEPVHATSWGRGLLPAGWLANGMLLAFERFRVPSEVKSLDLATGRTAPFRTFEPRDIGGVMRVVRVQVTPDGRNARFRVVVTRQTFQQTQGRCAGCWMVDLVTPVSVSP